MAENKRTTADRRTGSSRRTKNEGTKHEEHRSSKIRSSSSSRNSTLFSSPRRSSNASPSISPPVLISSTNTQAYDDRTPHRQPPPPTPPRFEPFPPDHDNRIPPHAVREVLALLAPLLQHIPHAVVGVAAMCMHGYRGRRPTHISIIAPQDCKQALLTWARATSSTGAVVALPERNTLGVTTSDGVVRAVRVRFFRPPWEELRVQNVRMPGGPGGRGVVVGRILALASLVDVIARAWLYEGTANMAQERMCCLAEDVCWLLQRMVERGEDFDRVTGAALLDTEFWEPFVALYPGAIDLMRRAGVPVDARDELLAMELGIEMEMEPQVGGYGGAERAETPEEVPEETNEVGTRGKRRSVICSFKSLSALLKRHGDGSQRKERRKSLFDRMSIVIDRSPANWSR